MEGASLFLHLTPDDLLAKLVTLVPPLKGHAVRYHGVFAPHSRARRRVVPPHAAPSPPAASCRPTEAQSQTEPVPTRTYRVPWADLLKKVFTINVLACPECSGRMKLIAFVPAPRDGQETWERHAGAACAPFVGYRRREPEKTLLHQVVSERLETFLEAARDRSAHGRGLPAFVQHELRAYLDGGILAHGVARIRCLGFDFIEERRRLEDAGRVAREHGHEIALPDIGERSGRVRQPRAISVCDGSGPGVPLPRAPLTHPCGSRRRPAACCVLPSMIFCLKKPELPVPHRPPPSRAWMVAGRQYGWDRQE
jgi:hypothetical protein